MIKIETRFQENRTLKASVSEKFHELFSIKILNIFSREYFKI